MNEWRRRGRDDRMEIQELKILYMWGAKRSLQRVGGFNWLQFLKIGYTELRVFLATYFYMVTFLELHSWQSMERRVRLLASISPMKLELLNCLCVSTGLPLKTAMTGHAIMLFAQICLFTLWGSFDLNGIFNCTVLEGMV